MIGLYRLSAIFRRNAPYLWEFVRNPAWRGEYYDLAAELVIG
jgi:hypothetical protein